MKKWLLIPAVLFPYLTIAVFASFFMIGNRSDIFAAAFLDHIGLIGLATGMMLLLAISCNLAFMMKNRNAPPVELVHIALIVKCLYIPAYILVFVVGLILGLMIFMTLPLILLLIFLDLVFLWLTNMLSIFALIKTRNHSVHRAIALVCQFFFCADIGSLLLVSSFLNRHIP